MNKKQKEKWNKYCQAEKNGIRRRSMLELKEFISLLHQSDPEEYSAFVFDLCSNVIDKHSDFPIRTPLFEEIIFPVIWKGCKNEVLGCARWLAGFGRFICQSKTILNFLGNMVDYNETYFLKLAIKHNPNDLIAKKKLIETIAWRLSYSIHEIPAGFLWDNDGASIEQCALLRDELSEFKVMVSKVGKNDKYKKLIAECSLHFSEYPKYLLNKEEYGLYSTYFTDKKLWK